MTTKQVVTAYLMVSVNRANGNQRANVSWKVRRYMRKHKIIIMGDTVFQGGIAIYRIRRQFLSSRMHSCMEIAPALIDLEKARQYDHRIA